MLETLRIQNYALIASIEVEFAPGFNVLTGETGAGKSIVAGALNLVLGARAAGEVLRAGAERAKIEALFRLPEPTRRLRALLEAHDISMEDDALLLSRIISRDGRSKAYAGGSLVPLAVLSEIGDELVDLHGQHEHQSLLKPEHQLALLDAFGGTVEQAEAVAALVAQWREVERASAALESDDRDRTRQLEFLRFELQEIDGAALQPDEEQELSARIQLISNAERVHTLASEAYTALYEGADAAAIDRVDTTLGALHELQSISEQFAPLNAQLTEARAALEAVADELRGHTEMLDFDAEELETLNQRRALLGALKRKYGATIEDILAHRDRIAKDLDLYEHRDQRLEELRARRDALAVQAHTAAEALSENRKAAAEKLDTQVAGALGDLAMKGAQFNAHFAAAPLSSQGLDRVEFLLAANAGEKAKPLRQVASGGEISRIMLALKSVFAEADSIPTLIFDEIDAGVGGAVARDVADKLRALAASHQVICISHLPQLAACANAHFSVSKASENGRTRTELHVLDNEARVREVARLLDGSVSEVSLEHARMLLAEAAGTEAEAKPRTARSKKGNGTGAEKSGARSRGKG